MGDVVVKRHSLPGEGGDSAWFRRLNDFQQQETRRQVKFKRRRWPELPDGTWSKRPTYSYPHILPRGHLKKAFYRDIADDVQSYCDENDIALSTEARNLKSSQVACFNVMFPMRSNAQLAKTALRPLLPGVDNVSRMEFEYTGDEGATDWLGEPPGGKRGQNRTSIDVAIWWEDAEKSILTLVEWKYTEPSFGTCGGFQSRGNKNRQVCRKLRVTSPQAAKRCYLTQERNKRCYWRRMKEAGIDLTALARVKGCPFRGPFYQLLRQYLLAAYLRQSKEADRVGVASVAFRGNHSLHRVPRHLRQLGDSVIAAWNSALQGVPELRHVDVEDIVAAMRADDSSAARSLVSYLNDRYGL